MCTPRRLLHLTAALLLAVPGAAQGPGADLDTWPTLHRDNARSGWFPERIQGPYERKWFRDFHDEMIATRAEAIVAEGRVYVGTYAGKVHALRVTDGATAWSRDLGAAIGHSPLYMAGRLYVGCQDGRLWCLDASDGTALWSYRAGAGIWVHPSSDGHHIYFGDRAGVFHAVDLRGKAAWTHPCEHMILTPASIGPEGRVVFAAEDMRLRCFTRDGEQLWTTEKLSGLSLRDHAPTVWRGLVLVRSNPAQDFHSAFGVRGATFKAFHGTLELDGDDEVLLDRWGAFAMRPTERRAAAERDWIRRSLAEDPHRRTFHARRLEDGSEPWTAPVLYTGGLHNPATPPTFNPETGALHVWGGTGLSNFTHGVPGGFVHVLGLDPETGDTSHLAFPADTGLTGTAFAQPSDEAFALSLMGDVLINTHMGSVLGLDLDDMSFAPIHRARDTYGGIFGRPTALEVEESRPGDGFYAEMRRAHRRGVLVHMPNEWHGPDRAIVSIASERLFWISGSQVVCLGGPSLERTATGGGSLPEEPLRRARLPSTPAGNVAVDRSELDGDVPLLRVGAAQLRPWLEPPARRPAPATADQERARGELEAQVAALVEGDWAPWALELGIAGVETHFARSAETMRALASALPHLPDDLRAEAVAALDRMWEAGVPLRQRGLAGARRREHHVPSGAMLRDAETLQRRVLSSTPELADLDAVWAYAHHADRWEAAAASMDVIRSVHADAPAPDLAFGPEGAGGGDAVERLNRRLAGTLAYARLVDRLGSPDEVDEVLAEAADLLTRRVHHERADRGLVRMSSATSGSRSHAAHVPRYAGLTREVAEMIRALAGESLARNLRAIDDDLPVWYLAWGERLIGGENYTNPPTLAHGVFTAFAWSGVADADELRTWIDQPWVRADLYHLQKLVALLAR